jgi:hypothetical protein
VVVGALTTESTIQWFEGEGVSRKNRLIPAVTCALVVALGLSQGCGGSDSGLALTIAAHADRTVRVRSAASANARRPAGAGSRAVAALASTRAPTPLTAVDVERPAPRRRFVMLPNARARRVQSSVGDSASI